MTTPTVHCRHCNAPNPLGSKFCNKCGTPLPPSTSLICPNCGQSNPHHLLYCDNCGTRLVQDSAAAEDPVEDEPVGSPPRAFSLPERQPGDTAELDPSLIPDWLRSGHQNEAEEQVKADLNNWLSQLAGHEDDEDEPVSVTGRLAALRAQQSEEQAGDGGDDPDWMDDSTFGDPLSDDADWLDEADPAGATGQLDDWLDDLEREGQRDSDLPAGETAETETAAPPSAKAEDELADWLTDLRTETAAPSDESTDALDEELLAMPTPEDELPDWLDNLEETGPETAVGDRDINLAGDDIPDWVADLRPSAGPVTSPAGEAEPPDMVPSDDLEEADLPDWFEERLEVGDAPPETVRAPKEARQISYDDLPDWLQPEEAAENFDAALEAALAADEQERPRPSLESDVWETLLGDKLEDAPTDEPAAPLTEAEIPTWLQTMRPGDKTEGDGAPEAPEETAGPLAGLRGVVDIEPIIARPREATPAPRLAVTAEHEQQVALLRQLQHETAPPATVVTRRRSRAMSVVVRVLLVLLLLLAVVAGLFLAGLIDMTPPLLSTGTEGVHDALVDAAGRPVLVAMDISPAMAGALLPQAEAILTELESNNSQALIVTQLATGVGVVEELLDGRDAALLGFVPGEAIGLRRLGGCLNGDGACASLAGRAPAVALSDVALVVVLTGERDNLISWIEQVGAATSIPVIAGVTAGLAPVALPYVASGQLSGLLEGLPATAAYERAFLPDSDAATSLLSAQATGQWTAAVLITLGAVWYGLTGFVTRSRSDEERDA